jgi:RNA polymerase sigma-70 factor (ECF subfamily)
LIPGLDRAAREAGPRIRAALAARFRSLDLAEEGWAEACARAAARWPADGAPADSGAWLYRTAERAIFDLIRRQSVRDRLSPLPPDPTPGPEDEMLGDHCLIPDERLRLIFVCCHPAVAPDSRAALTLKMVCGLDTAEIARAFLLPEPTLAQRLVRAKRKIAEAGVPFEVPGPAMWRERLEAVLITVEIAYAKAHEDAAGTGAHSGFAPEMLTLTAALAELIPDDSDVRALAATIRFAEARRPARADAEGLMIPLSEQDPARWDQALIHAGRDHLASAGGESWRVLQAGLHAAWCRRESLTVRPPWPVILCLYDRMLAYRDDPVVRINRAVALAEVQGPTHGLAELDRLDHPGLERFTPFLAARADLMRRSGRNTEAQAAYDTLLAQPLAQAERRWLERRRAL